MRAARSPESSAFDFTPVRCRGLSLLARSFTPAKTGLPILRQQHRHLADELSVRGAIQKTRNLGHGIRRLRTKVGFQRCLLIRRAQLPERKAAPMICNRNLGRADRNPESVSCRVFEPKMVDSSFLQAVSLKMSTTVPSTFLHCTVADAFADRARRKPS